MPHPHVTAAQSRPSPREEPVKTDSRISFAIDYFASADVADEYGAALRVWVADCLAVGYSPGSTHNPSKFGRSPSFDHDGLYAVSVP